MTKEENTLKEAIQALEKAYGKGIVMKLDDTIRADVEVIPTGSISLDTALGIGGVPLGRLIEVYGPESSGKTTLALHIIAEAQKKKYKCAYIDAEHALDTEYAEKLGVKTKELYLVQPDYGEQALDVIDKFLHTREFKLIVVDSVAALTPQAEIEAKMGAQFMGLQARLMSQALRKLTPLAATHNTTILFINQIRTSIGVVYGNPEYTPGGKALKFYTSMRIEIRRSAKLKQGEEFIGNRVKVKVAKNKLAAPFKVAEFNIIFNEGIQKENDLIQMSMQQNLIRKEGNSYFYGTIKLGGSAEKAKVFLKKNKDVYDKLFSETVASLKAVKETKQTELLDNDS